MGAERVKQSAAECWGKKRLTKSSRGCGARFNTTTTTTPHRPACQRGFQCGCQSQPKLTAMATAQTFLTHLWLSSNTENLKWETHVWMSSQLHQY